MEPMRSYKVGKDRYLNVTDLLARIALAATAIGIAMDTGKMSREEAKGSLTVLIKIKEGLDSL